MNNETKNQENSERKAQLLQCQFHSNNEVIAINISKVDKHQLKCIQCIIEDNLQGSNLLSISDITSTSFHSTIKNWPPLNKISTLDEINHILLHEKQDIYSRISLYFEDFRQKFEMKIKSVEKQIVHRTQQYLSTCSPIIDAYNTLSEKEYLKSLFKIDSKNKNNNNNTCFNYNELHNKIQSLVEQKLIDREKNTDLLKQIVDKFVQTNKVASLLLPETFKEEFLNSLSKIEVLSKSEHTFCERVESMVEHKQVEQIQVENLNQCMQPFQQLVSHQQLEDLTILAKKMSEIKNQNIEENILTPENPWGILRQNSHKVYLNLKNSHFCSQSKEDISQIIMRYPIFDVIQPLIVDVHNKLFSSVKLTNQFQLVMSGNPDYQQGKITTDAKGKQSLEKNQKDGYVVCYTNTVLNYKDKYQIKVSVEKNSKHDWIVFGLMPDSAKDRSTLYEYKFCYHYGYQDAPNHKIVRGSNMQSDYIIEGEVKTLEMRISLQDQFIMISDFPQHQNVNIMTQDNTKGSFNQNEKYRFSIALYNQADKVTLEDVQLVQEFSQI